MADNQTLDCGIELVALNVTYLYDSGHIPSSLCHLYIMDSSNMAKIVILCEETDEGVYRWTDGRYTFAQFFDCLHYCWKSLTLSESLHICDVSRLQLVWTSEWGSHKVSYDELLSIDDSFMQTRHINFLYQKYGEVFSCAINIAMKKLLVDPNRNQSKSLIPSFSSYIYTLQFKLDGIITK